MILRSYTIVKVFIILIPQNRAEGKPIISEAVVAFEFVSISQHTSSHILPMKVPNGDCHDSSPQTMVLKPNHRCLELDPLR